VFVMKAKKLSPEEMDALIVNLTSVRSSMQAVVSMFSPLEDLEALTDTMRQVVDKVIDIEVILAQAEED